MNYHFIAIGGAVMHNLALELLAHGHTVTGSDDEIFDPAKGRLQTAGILPQAYGWFPEKIHTELDGIILGMHAKKDNPELLRAQELGVPIYSFPEFIFEKSRNKKRIVIGGSHGKTTCTAMLMHVLQECGLDFDYLVGSQLAGFERMVRISDAPVIVIEGDEYLTSVLHPVPKFHVYQPHHAMITGVAWDHVNVFPTYENYLEQFEKFLQTIEPNGSFFWFAGDPDLAKMAKASAVKNQSYAEPNFQSTESGTMVSVNGAQYPLQIFGRHNLQNAAGVAMLAGELGITADKFWSAMQNFTGTAKRLEKVYDDVRLTIFRDFAHAPSKVKASVAAVREQYPDRDFIAVFELHTYSSLREDFLPGYHGSLNPADHAFLLFDPHVYALKNMPVPTAEKIEETVGNCTAFSDANQLKNAILSTLQGERSKVLLLMSSGNLGGIKSEEFVQK